MNAAHDIYLEACRRGLRIEPAGEHLAVYPKGKCPADFADVLRLHKAELLDWLSAAPCPGWGSVPPYNLPLSPIVPRPGAKDRERMISYLLRQGCDWPGPLTEWLVRREFAYYDGLGQHWDCALHAYAAARDAACWQLNRTESEVLDLLAGFDECSRKGEMDS